MAEPKPSMRAFPAGSFSGQPLGSGAHPLADPGALLPPLRGCNSRCEERESFPGEAVPRAGQGRCQPRGKGWRWLPAGRCWCRSRLRQPRGCHWPRDASLGRAGPGRAAAGGSGGRAARRGGSGAGRGPGHRSVPLPLMARLFLLLPLP